MHDTSEWNNIQKCPLEGDSGLKNEIGRNLLYYENLAKIYYIILNVSLEQNQVDIQNNTRAMSFFETKSISS